MTLDANITEATNPSLFTSSVEPVPSREAFSVRQSFLLPPMLMAGRQSTLGAAGDPPSAEVQVVPLQGMMWLNNLTTTAAPASPKPMRLFPPVAFGGGKAPERGVKEIALSSDQHFIVTYSAGGVNDLGVMGATLPAGSITPTQAQVTAAVAALDMTATVNKVLGGPLVIEGLKYASSTLNYDSQRDGWGAVTALPPAELKDLATQIYEVGLPGRIYTGTSSPYSDMRGYALGGSAVPMNLNDVATVNFTLKESLVSMGVRLGLPSSATLVAATVTYRLRLLKGSSVLLDRTSTGDRAAVRGYSVAEFFEVPQLLTPGAYTIEYTLLATSGDQDYDTKKYLLRGINAGGTAIDNPAFVRVPFADEDWNLYLNGQSVGLNAGLSLMVRWADPTLCQPISATPDGGDLVAVGSGLVQRGNLPVAPMRRELNSGQTHRMVVEFTPEPLSSADHYRLAFGFLAAPAAQATYLTDGRANLLVRGLLGGGLYRPGDQEPLALRITQSASANSTAIKTLNFDGPPPRLRLEYTLFFGRYPDASLGFQYSEGWNYTYQLFDAVTGATLIREDSVTDSLQGGNAQSLGFAPTFAFFLTPPVPDTWPLANNSVSWTTSYGSNPARSTRVPAGVEKPARVRIHRWLEWRQEAK